MRIQLGFSAAYLFDLKLITNMFQFIVAMNRTTLKMSEGKGVLLTLLFLLLNQALYAQSPGGINEIAWFKADQGVVTTNSEVQKWADQSGNGFDVSKNGSHLVPSLVSGETVEFNFNPFLDFGAYNRHLIRHAAFGVQQGAGASGDDVTIFVVARPSSVTGLQTMVEFGSEYDYQAPFMGLYLASTALQTPNIGNDDDEYVFGPAVKENNSFIVGYAWKDSEDNGDAEIEVMLNGIYQMSHQDLTNARVEKLSIGAGISNSFGWKGKIAEVVIYNQKLTGDSRRKVESYLALKYGIALDQSSANNYIASNGAVVWDATGEIEYKHGIIGLCRDDASGLNQKVAKTMSNDAVLTMALDNEFTKANNDNTRQGNHQNDLQFLMVAHNGKPGKRQTYEIDGQVYIERAMREWKVKKTNNFSQAVNLKFDGFAGFLLLKDSDGDFSTGVEQIGTLDANGVINNVVLEDGKYYTLARLGERARAGGVYGSVWLKAGTGFVKNAGNASWGDQFGNGYGLTQKGSNPTPDLVLNTKAFNFNPALHFDGGNKQLYREGYFGIDEGAAATGDGATVFAVARAVDSNDYRTLVEFGGESDDEAPFMGLHNGNVALETPSIPSDDNDYIVGAPYTLNTTVMLGYTWKDSPINGGADISTMLNGVDVLPTTNHDMTNAQGDKLSIGAGISNDQGWRGHIAEVVIYDYRVDDVQRQKIESYLALKYGITLDQSSETNYIASDGSVIWDASLHQNEKMYIIGLGRDDISSLDQRVATSSGVNSVLSIALDNDFTSENGPSRTALNHNFQFMTVSSNGMPVTAQTNEMTSEYESRIMREWKVQKTTNFNQTTFLKFDGFSTNHVLLVDDDGDFSTGATEVGALSNDGVIEATINNGQYFTLAVKNTMSIEDNYFGSQIVVAPNPVNDQFSVSFNTPVQKAQFQIIDVLGRTLKVEQRNIVNNRAQFNVSDLSTGEYYLQITSGNTTTVKRLLVR